MRSVCVFETSKDEPLWRRGGPFVSGLPNTELHVRFIMPNGNYDYIVTYQFKLDGHVRVDIGSSGYIQGHFMPPDRGAKDSMAYRVHTYTGSSLHDHTFSFKVDLDVGGETNTFETVAYKSGKTLDAINAGRADEYTVAPEYFLFDTMRYVEYTTVEKEEDSLLSIDPAAPKTWLFGDTTNKNKWGSTKAYAIVLDANPSGLVDPASHTLPAFNFYKQMLAVTVYKDEEITSTGPYDLNRLDDPQVTFDKFVNGESIVQEDIVAWVTLSMHHLPTTENMPMTNSIKHGFVLAPHNFFDENPAMDLPHYLRMMDESDNRTEDLQAVPNCVPFEYDTTHTFSGV
jgi:Cu2+-containing amine oxidase